MNTRVSYWLMPAERENAQLTETIRHLALRTGGPVFQPHVTLYGGPAESRERITDILGEVARGVPEVVLKVAGLGQSEEFTRTVFLEFAANDALKSLAAKLARLSPRPEVYELKPHLSLVYSSMEASQRRAFADSITVPKTIRFDLLKAVFTGRSTRSCADVDSWRVVAEKRLG
jgi:putative hydrolase of the HAD superfamily